MFDREAFVECYENSLALSREALENELKAASGKLIEHLLDISSREFERRSNRAGSSDGLSVKDQRDILEMLGEDIAAKLGSVAKVHVENHHRFKNEIHNEINPFDIMKCDSIEEIEDNQRRIIKEYEVRKKYKRVFRSHFKRLDVKSFEILSALYDNEVPAERLGEAIGRISGYDIDTLNQKLSNFLSSYSKDLEYFVNLIEEDDIDAEVMYNEGGVLLISIDSGEAAASALAKGDWCIADEGAGYYDDYLVHGDSLLEEETHNSENNKDNNGNYTNELEGKHFYAYDFNIPESDSCRYIAFTVSASGDITAAFDKNNKDIKGTVRFDTLTKNYLEMARKHATYDYEQIKKMRWDFSEILLDSNMLTNNYFDPLQAFRDLVTEGRHENYGFSIMSNAVDKSIRNSEDPVKLLDNIFWLSDFLKKYEKRHEIAESHNEPNEDGDLEEYERYEYEFDDEYLFDENDDEYLVERGLESGDLLDRPKIGEVVENLTPIQRDLLFKKRKDDIQDFVLAEINKNYRNLGNKISMNNKVANNFARNVIAANREVLDKSSLNELTLMASGSSNFDKSMVENLFQRDIHKSNMRIANTIMDNMELFPDSVLDRFAEYLNSNDLDLDMSSKRLSAIACNEEFLSKLNEQGVESFRSSSRRLDISDHYSEFTVFGKPNFLERMSRLYKVGIIDDYSLDHCMNTSRISISEMDVRGEDGKIIPGMDFKEHIRGSKGGEQSLNRSQKARNRP